MQGFRSRVSLNYMNMQICGNDVGNLYCRDCFFINCRLALLELKNQRIRKIKYISFSFQKEICHLKNYLNDRSVFETFCLIHY